MHDQNGRKTFIVCLLLCLLAATLAISALRGCAAAGQDKPQQSEAKDCGGANIVLMEGKLDLPRACEIYRDLAVYHLIGSFKRPSILFHVVKVLDCNNGSIVSAFLSMAVACGERTKNATEIYLAEDKPEYYIGLMVDTLDYANQLYLPRGVVVSECGKVLAELQHPELRKRFHGTVDVHDLKRK